MSDDRALLEAAARAAGYNFQWEPALLNEWPEPTVFTPEGFGQYWNPLTDDGDALRLAVKLGICFGPNFDGDLAVCFGSDGKNITEPFANDPYAATRRAIVRAAASLGSAQEGTT